LQVEIKGVAKAVIDLVDGRVADWPLSLRTDEPAGLCLCMICSKDCTMNLRRRSRHDRPSGSCNKLKRQPLSAHSSINGKRVQRGIAPSGVASASNLVQYVWRHDTEDGVPVNGVAGVRVHGDLQSLVPNNG